MKVENESILNTLIFFSAAVWGVYWIPLREIEELGFSSSWTVVLMNACPLIVLYPIFILKFKQLRSHLVSSIVASLMIGFAFTFYAISLVETTVIRATLLFYLNPIWGTIFGVFWLSEQLTQRRIISISIAFLGLYFLLFEAGSISSSPNLGDLYAISSGICWAFGATELKKRPGGSVLVITTLVYSATTITSICFAALIYKDPSPELVLIRMAIPIAIIWSIIVLLPAFMIIFKISQYLYPGRVGILMMSEVIVAVISAYILLPGETLILSQWIGALFVIMAGVIEVVYRTPKAKTNNQKNNRNWF